MTQPDRLTIEEVESWNAGSNDEAMLARQLADTMRENDALKRHPLKMICEKCNILTDVHQNKESSHE